MDIWIGVLEADSWEIEVQTLRISRDSVLIRGATHDATNGRLPFAERLRKSQAADEFEYVSQPARYSGVRGNPDYPFSIALTVRRASAKEMQVIGEWRDTDGAHEFDGYLEIGHAASEK